MSADSAIIKVSNQSTRTVKVTCTQMEANRNRATAVGSIKPAFGDIDLVYKDAALHFQVPLNHYYMIAIDDVPHRKGYLDSNVPGSESKDAHLVWDGSKITSTKSGPKHHYYLNHNESCSCVRCSSNDGLGAGTQFF